MALCQNALTARHMANAPTNKSRTSSLHDDAYALVVQLLVDKRTKTGMSQQAVADALGWNQSTIARIESVQRRMDIVELIRIANVVGFDVSRFVRDAQTIVSASDKQ